MAASSLFSLSLSSRHGENHIPKFPNPAIRNPSKVFIPNPSSSYLHRHPKFRQLPGRLSIPPKPTTDPLISALFSQPKKNIFRFYVEKIAILLLGSLLFVGCVRAKPALTVPLQESEVFEEKRDSRTSDDEGEEMWEKLLQENPNDINVLKTVVNLKMRKGKTDEAVEIVEKLIELQPNEMEWRLLQALCCEMMGDLSEAKSLFKNILKQKPLMLRALHGLAMVMHKKCEGAAVFEMLERALEVAQREEKVNEERNIRILVAQMHLVKGELEEALEKFQGLIDENPRDFRPYLCQGIVYSLMEKEKEAEEKFEMYKSLVPQEFPQRRFLDDVVLAAKAESKLNLRNHLQR